MAILEQHSPTGDNRWDKKKIKKATQKLFDEIYEYSNRLYAESEQSVLLVLQGMDASGKDGLTRKLFQQTSPAWVNVHSFKKPNNKEMAQDYLWRIHQRTPAKGLITVFNRSYYEDILVPSVYGFIKPEIIEQRYEQINHFEKHLEENGTKIVKCYLNLSYEKQHEKLRERIENPAKNWKHSDGDWETRKHWHEFMDVYETLFERCNTVPWHIIPCDHNWTKEYAAAKILVETLKQMDPQFPKAELSLEKY